MQYRQESEKVAMMPIGNNPVIPIQTPLTEHPQIQSTRKTLIIILSVFLGLAIVGLLSAIVGYLITSDETRSRGVGNIFEGFAAICYYGFGILVAHRYSATGLRVFAWLTIVFLTLSTIGFMILVPLFIFGASFLQSLAKDMEGGNQQFQWIFNFSLAVIIVALIFFSIAFIISVILIKLSFKLARLINVNNNSVIQQM